MSTRRADMPKLDLKLNLSPPRPNLQLMDSPNLSVTVSSMEMSPAASCVTTEPELETVCYSSSPEVTSMVLVGCPRCLMYVMLSAADPKCPKCKSSVLLDFLNEKFTKKTRN